MLSNCNECIMFPADFEKFEPSWAILSIDRSEPRFESHTGGKIRET